MSESLPRAGTFRQSREDSGLVGASVLLALLPPTQIAWITFAFGENNLSNDYIQWAPFVATVVEGGYVWSHWFQDTWVRFGHCMALPVLVHAAVAKFAHWNMDVELAVGLLLFAAKLVLIWLALTRTLKPGPRWVLLPVLSLLTFPTSQISTFTFGDSTLQMGFSQLGLALGVYGAARHLISPSNRPVLAAGWMAAGGLVASWSWGGGLMAWPVFAAALLYARVRRPAPFAILAGGGVLGMAPYFYFLFLHPILPGTNHLFLRHAFSVSLGLLGRPFLNGTGREFGRRPAGEWVGAFGVFACLALLYYLRRAPIKQRAHALPALMLGAWASLVVVQIAVLRNQVAPWYISPVSVAWLGLVGLAAVLFNDRNAKRGRVLSAAAVAVVVLLALRVSASWEDKSFYLPSRAPASAACLREWRTISQACEVRVFQWGPVERGTTAILAAPLERAGLSVFGPRRTYLLQGDVILGRVSFELGDSPAFFSREERISADPNDFHRLNLVLPPGASATWRVDLPPNLVHAVFRTRMRATDSTTDPEGTVEIEDLSGEKPKAPIRSAIAGSGAISLDLVPFVGRSVSVRIDGGVRDFGSPPVVLEAPRIELEIGSGPARADASKE